MDECLEGCKLVLKADDITKTLTTEVWAIHYTGNKAALLWESTKPYPMTAYLVEELWLNEK